MNNTRNNWWKRGLWWAFFNYVIIVIVLPLIMNEEISTNKLLIAIPIYLIAGLVFGYITRKSGN